MPYIREDQADIRVSVDGVAYGDSWKSVEGGNLEADDSKTRPGGMGREVALGGPASRDDVTVATQLTDVVLGWHKGFESKVGNGRVKVAYTFLGANRLRIGPTHTVTGVLKAANLPDFDSESSDPGMYEIIVSSDEQAL